MLPEVKAEVIDHYRNIKDSKGKQKLTDEDVQEIVDYIFEDIEIIPIPNGIGKAFSAIWDVMRSVGWSDYILKDNITDIMVCATAMLDDGHVGALDKLISEIWYIFSDDMILYPVPKPMAKERQNEITRGLMKAYGRVPPLDFGEFLEKDW